MRELILIRHAETEPDWSLPPSEWRLSEAGLAQARELARAEFWQRVVLACSSDEPKALQTARPAAERHALQLLKLARLREVWRPAGRLKNYDAAVRSYLEGRESEGWESLERAERRICRSVGMVLRKRPDSNVAIVSHGLVLTLYACRLLGLGDRFGFWRKIPFAGYARVDPKAAVLLKEFK